MTKSWQTRIEPKPHSRAAREEAADALIEQGDTLIKKLAIHEQPSVSVYQRYSGYLASRHNDYITGHERYECHTDRDNGAARLMQIYSEQLRHMVPRPAREAEPFNAVSSKAISRMSQVTTALYEDTHALLRLNHHHGARYRKQAEPLLAVIHDDIREMRLALRSIHEQLHGGDVTEKTIIGHCKGLLNVIEHCHQHAMHMLPSLKIPSAGRAS